MDGDGDSSGGISLDVPRRYQLGGGIACLILFLLTSVAVVKPLQYGILYNRFNMYVDIDTVYGPGRHIVFPWNKFLRFPSTVQSVEFTAEPELAVFGTRFSSLHTRTKEGLALHMQVSLQYQLIRDKVGHLYRDFNIDYQSFFIGVIRDTLIRVAAEYEAFELWEKRQDVGRVMQQEVDAMLQKAYARCWGLQLLDIELPPSFDTSIVATQVVNQNISSMEFEQLALQIHAQTKVIQAEFDKKVKVVKAKGRANYTLTTKTAKAHAKSKTLMTESGVLGSIKGRLKVAADGLLEYQEYANVAMLPNASVYFGFNADSDVILAQPKDAPGSGGAGGAAGRSLSDAGASVGASTASQPMDLEGQQHRGDEL
mmetsp:Transcript_84742/g.244992  ORF Transcript_84742/g.244992 Transcript_84742/m.244992 type:complete len:369 (+) Transcript_84742:85-1191(+)